MERFSFQVLLLLILSLAVGCGDIRTLDNEATDTISSKLITSNGLTYPIASMGSWSNTNYGACGTYYSTNPFRCHTGADVMTGAGTPVYAMAAGTIMAPVSASQNPAQDCSSGWGYDYGLSNTCNMAIAVQHYDASGQPFVAIYGHLRYNPSYGVGTTFLAGQKIGVIGRYYHVNGTAISLDHLHWGIKPGTSSPVNWGRVACSVSQPPSTTLPPDCNPDAFVAPGSYMSSHFPALRYTYDGNAYTCSGPVTGGAEMNWTYTCLHPRANFTQGETVYSIIRINNIQPYTQFRYKVDAIKDGVQNWSWTTGWSDTGQWTWEKSYFWPTMSNAQQGNWIFRFSVDTGSGFTFVDSRKFSVAIANPPYSYNSAIVTCTGPITGGADTNWVYTCQNPAGRFYVGNTVSALVRIDSLNTDFRWKTEVYANGVLRWTDTTGWNDVGDWGWEKAYYWPTTGSVWLAGNWEYRVYVDTGNGYWYLDSAYFTVSDP